MTQLNRRTVILGGMAGVGTALAGVSIARAASYPFTLGVASGEPTADGFVLWTRLAPSPLNADGLGGMSSANVTVEWQVATDQYFTTLAASGSTTAVQAWAHSVHVEVSGLQPNSEYWYRFRASGQISPVGRARTAPAVGTSPTLKMLFASCSHYEAGYFTAYRRMAEETPDLILHLGDYIYEGGAGSSGVRTHQPSAEITSLANYRVRHALYKTDVDLQAAHAVAPWIPVWDDHEVENNYANLVRENSTPAGDFTARRAAAYKAYYEHMPLRSAQIPVSQNMQLYRRLRWGSLATFHMLDTRQYRDDQACGDGTQVCADADLASRTLTGATQETWLLNGLGQHLGTWDIIGQQVFFAQRLSSAAGAKSMDAWDGYTANRGRIQAGWQATGNDSVVVLTGDVHQHWAANIMDNYTTQNQVIGTELVTTSITSGGDGTGAGTGLSTLNPHVKFNWNRRGYVRTVTTPAQMTVDFRVLNQVTVRGLAVSTAQSYVIQAGNPGLQTV
ncbi:alkaline phosphatase [Frankia sp. CcI49]|uniref:alkaline phosphatase D family protein n=1 Tax=unclassified Frankia TaxID=2632575 RepID=UPI0006C9FA1B|nr:MULTISPECIES: alkaline phosphatase D family protein [unclassified Frankia]KPM50467.1 alkaline phosphatase [Frankia sp. R43]ONH58035.1 alkaline phosphatase [Frankia sp. CcI49]